MPTADGPHILLVNPWVHDFAAYDVWAKPMGLLRLASILRDHGCTVAYIDCLDRFHPKTFTRPHKFRNGRGPYLKTQIAPPPGLEDIPRAYSRYGIMPEWLDEDLARQKRPDLIFVTSLMTYWWPGVKETIDFIKHRFSASPIILGGIYATLCKTHAEKHAGADAIVTGPGEMEALKQVGMQTGVMPNPAFSMDDMDSFPYPAFDLQTNIPYIPILTSQGCPFSCTYCASPFLQPKRMHRSTENVAAEIAFWHRDHAVKDFAFYDDALLIDAESHVLPLLEQIVRSGMQLRFHTPNALHIRELNREISSLMYRSGFKTVRLGLETAMPADRRDLDQKTSFPEFTAAVEHLHLAGFSPSQIGVYLLVGLPGQSLEAVMASIDRVKQAGATPIAAYYTPIPHTRLWAEAKVSSRYDLERDPVFANNAIFPCQKEPFDWGRITEIKNRIAA